MQIRYLPKDFVKSRLIRLTLFEAPIFIIGILGVFGFFQVRNGVQIGIGALLAGIVGTFFMYKRLTSRIICEECKTPIYGNPKDGYICEACKIKYVIGDK